MAKPATEHAAMRKNISLIGEDAHLIDKLKQAIEKRLKISITHAQVVRMALRELEVTELKEHS